jgi:hypothetical protein
MYKLQLGAVEKKIRISCLDQGAENIYNVPKLLAACKRAHSGWNNQGEAQFLIVEVRFE